MFLCPGILREPVIIATILIVSRHLLLMDLPRSCDQRGMFIPCVFPSTLLITNQNNSPLRWTYSRIFWNALHTMCRVPDGLWLCNCCWCFYMHVWGYWCRTALRCVLEPKYNGEGGKNDPFKETASFQQHDSLQNDKYDKP